MFILVILVIVGLGAIAGKIFFERAKIRNLFEVSEDKIKIEAQKVEKEVEKKL